MAERDEKIDMDSGPEAEAENLGIEEEEEARDVEDQMASQEKEEEILKKKYGGLVAKKPPLISKDHERAFFDSADWALGKKSKGPLEALRPKLQPSPHHQAPSKSPCAPADGQTMDDPSHTDPVPVPVPEVPHLQGSNDPSFP